ncbi:hypothetical protein ACCC97_23650 [Variovorax sp. Varisp85]
MSDTKLEKLVSDLGLISLLVFAVAIGSAVAYGLWQWVLSPSIPLCR